MPFFLSATHVLLCETSGLGPNGPHYMHLQAIGDGKVVRRRVSREVLVEGGIKVVVNDARDREEGIVHIETLAKPKISLAVRPDQLRSL